MSRPAIVAGKTIIVVDIQDKVKAGLNKIKMQLNRFSNNMSGMGLDLSLFGGGASGGMLLGLKSFQTFEDSILFLQTKLPATEAQFARITERVRELGRSTSFTAQEVAEGAVALAQAGFSVDEVDNSLQSMLDLARGARIEISTASTIMANTLRTFNIDAKHSAEVASQFIVAARKGTLDVVNLSESMKEVSGAFRNLNVDLETSLTLITAISSRNLRGTKAGTSINTALQQMANKAEDIKKIFGIDLADAMGNLKDPLQILEEMNKQLEQTGGLEKQQLLGGLYNIRGARAMTPLIDMAEYKQVSNTLRNLRSEIKNARNEARDAAKTMDEGIGGSVRRATSALQDLNITIQEIIAKAVQPLIENVVHLSNAMNRLATANKDLVLILTAVPPLAVLLGVGLLTTSFVFAKLAPLIGLVAAGFDGLFMVLKNMASAPLNLLNAGLDKAIRTLVSLDLLMGGLSPDRYAKGKKKGQPKPTSFMKKFGPMKIPFVAPLEKAVAQLVSLGTKGGVKVAAMLKDMVTLSGKVRKSVSSMLPDFRTIINLLFGSVNAVSNFYDKIRDLGKIIELELLTKFYMLEALLKGNWYFDLGGKQTKSFAEAIKFLTSGPLAKMRSLVAGLTFEFRKLYYMMDALLSGTWFFQLGTTQTKSFAAALKFLASGALVAVAKELKGIALDLGRITKLGAVLSSMSATFSRIAIATATWFSKIEAAKDAFFALTKTQRILLFYTALKNIGTMIVGLVTRITLLVKNSGAIGAILKGIIGVMSNLWKVVRSIDFIKIIYSMARGLTTVLSGLAKVTAGVVRFVFSWNFVWLALDVLILFGDKLPYIKDGLAAVGRAFGAFFSSLGELGTLTQGPLATIMEGFNELFAGHIEIGSDRIKAGFSSLVTIVFAQLSVAWNRFWEQLRPALDFFKTTFAVISAMVELIGASLGQILTSIGNIFGQAGGAGMDFSGTAQAVIETVGQLLSGIATTWIQAIDVVVQTLSTMYDALLGIANFLMSVARTFLSTVNTLMDAIPDAVLNKSYKNLIRAQNSEASSSMIGMQKQNNRAMESNAAFRDKFSQQTKSRVFLAEQALDKFMEDVKKAFEVNSAPEIDKAIKEGAQAVKWALTETAVENLMLDGRRILSTVKDIAKPVKDFLERSIGTAAEIGKKIAINQVAPKELPAKPLFNKEAFKAAVVGTVQATRNTLTKKSDPLLKTNEILGNIEDLIKEGNQFN